ncbi:MAG: ATP-dependent 6-phosphofructokinase [Deltaproteobacteria bacterium]|nr:ATP-dependent 6-phosphofructokinase [Deltaproteobacteria bacterium]
MTEEDIVIERLGVPRMESPVRCFTPPDHVPGKPPCKNFISDNDRVLVDASEKYFMECFEKGEAPLSFEKAGPRDKIFFHPKKVKCAIVTAGGLCPGLNDVIRSIVLELHFIYKVQNVIGIPFGYQGLSSQFNHEVIPLDPERVSYIHELGGTILSSSRGEYPVEDLVDTLQQLNVNILFAIGGDGTLRGANHIVAEIQRRGLFTSVIGIPKTIDNDIFLVEKSFGFDTAVETAAQVIRCAHTEATGAPNGIGLVKLMGRHSGFIAAYAALALREVNFVLIPESDFDLEGPQGLLEGLRRRLAERGHAVVVVAEGAGQKFFATDPVRKDPSGNIRLGDIGPHLVSRIKSFFEDLRQEINLKYIDPSYIIRSQPANFSDRIFCGFLGQHAVHAGMAGKTNMLVSLWNNEYIHVPIRAAVAKRKQVDLEGNMWLSVLESTGQPSLKNDPDWNACPAPDPGK